MGADQIELKDAVPLNEIAIRHLAHNAVDLTVHAPPDGGDPAILM